MRKIKKEEINIFLVNAKVLKIDYANNMVYISFPDEFEGDENLKQDIFNVFNKFDIKNNKKPFKEEGFFNFMIMKESEVKSILLLAMTSFKKYPFNDNKGQQVCDFVSFSIKRFTSNRRDDKYKHKYRYMNLKKVEYFVNSFFTLLKMTDKIEINDFRGYFPYLKSDLISKNIKYLINNRLSGMRSLIKDYFNDEEISLYEEILDKDVFDIINSTLNRRKINLINRLIGKKLSDEIFDEITMKTTIEDVKNFNNHNKERITHLQSKLEEELVKKNIYENEIIFILKKSGKENVINKNLLTLLNNKPATMDFLEKLTQVSDKMVSYLIEEFNVLSKFIDSEYKIITNPKIHTIENIISNLLIDVIYELVHLELKENYDNFINEINLDDERAPFYKFSSILLSGIQMNKNSLEKHISDFDKFSKNLDKNWGDIRYFVSSEDRFNLSFPEKRESNIEKRIKDYAFSPSFKYDLDFYISKYTFNNLMKLIKTLNSKKIKQILDSKETNDLSKIEFFYDLFWNDIYTWTNELTLLEEFRNTISHQSSIHEQANNELVVYEDIINEFTQKLDRKFHITSYKTQYDNLKGKIKEEMDNKVISYFHAFKQHSDSEKYMRFFVMRKFFVNFYKDVFGRNIFENVSEFKSPQANNGNDLIDDQSNMEDFE